MEEDAVVHTIEKKAIATPFMTPEIEVLVEVPTVVSLLGEKLTAFAPTTTGVPLRTEENGEGDVMQVMMQLFDVGTLFPGLPSTHAHPYPSAGNVSGSPSALEWL